MSLWEKGTNVLGDISNTARTIGQRILTTAEDIRSDAAKLFNRTFDNPNQQATDIDEILENENKPGQTKAIEPEPLASDQDDLCVALNLLRIEAMNNASKKAKISFISLKEVEAKVKKLNDLGQLIVQYTQGGELDLSKSQKAKVLLEEARQIGVVIARDKMRLTKPDRDALLKNVASKQKDLEIDMRQKTSDVQEAIRIRNEFFAILKSIYDKQNNVISGISRGIRESSR